MDILTMITNQLNDPKALEQLSKNHRCKAKPDSAANPRGFTRNIGSTSAKCHHSRGSQITQ